MNIDWAALFKVAGVSLLFGVGIVGVFSVGLMTLAGPAERDEQPPTATTRLLSGVCFALCAAAVLYGLWLIVPQFH